MAKELPYFQFEPAEYLTKDISFCSLSAQGLFINICSFYWQRQCDLSKEQFLRRFNYPNEFEELIKEGVIDIKNEKIKIKFLDSQYLKATEKSTINSNNGSKGGRPKKLKETEIKPNKNPIESESKGIREDNIIKDEIIENNKNDIFYNDLIISQQWLEQVAINNVPKFNIDEIKEKLLIFKNDLNMMLDIKQQKKEFTSHFVRWLNLQSKEIKKTEVNEKYKKMVF